MLGWMMNSEPSGFEVGQACPPDESVDGPTPTQIQ